MKTLTKLSQEIVMTLLFLVLIIEPIGDLNPSSPKKFLVILCPLSLQLNIFKECCFSNKTIYFLSRI